MNEMYTKKTTVKGFGVNTIYPQLVATIAAIFLVAAAEMHGGMTTTTTNKTKGIHFKWLLVFVFRSQIFLEHIFRFGVGVDDYLYNVGEIPLLLYYILIFVLIINKT